MKTTAWGAGILFGASVLVLAVLGPSGASSHECALKRGDKYMGVAKCKSCHSSEKRGNQYGQWEKTKHARAYEVLATEEAKKLAQKEGIEDPQNAPKCLKCHVTAFGVAKEELDSKFDIKMGVQCETCHGAAQKHVRNRLMDEDEDDKSLHEKAKKEMPLPSRDMCRKCHNEESATIEHSKFWDKEKREFKVEEAWKEVDHPNPMWRK